MVGEKKPMDEATHSRLVRIEDKLDRLAEGFLSLVRMEERMVTLFRRMDGYDQKQEDMNTRLSEIERATIGRGIFFRWLDRAGLAFVGAAMMYVIQRLGLAP